MREDFYSNDIATAADMARDREDPWDWREDFDPIADGVDGADADDGSQYAWTP